MNLTTTQRGFQILEHPTYPPESGTAMSQRLLQQSSAVGDYADSWDKPGSSYLYVGESHHLDRDEVRRLVAHLQAWLETGSLELCRDNPESCETVYVVKVLDLLGYAGMTHGPFRTLDEALAVVGDSDSVLLRFDAGKEPVLVRRWRDDSWQSP